MKIFTSLFTRMKSRMKDLENLTLEIPNIIQKKMLSKSNHLSKETIWQFQTKIIKMMNDEKSRVKKEDKIVGYLGN